MWRFLKKPEIELSYDPAIPLLGIYPEETKIEKDICIPLFIEALFTIARTWKQNRCPLTDEWMKKLWYIYTQWNIQFSSVAQWCPTLCDPMNCSTPGLRNAFELVLMRWMNLKPFIQSKVSQKEKDKYCILTHIYIWNLER